MRSPSRDVGRFIWKKVSCKSVSLSPGPEGRLLQIALCFFCAGVALGGEKMEMESLSLELSLTQSLMPQMDGRDSRA